MMALIYFVLLLAFLSAWKGRRESTFGFFIITLALSTATFLHHLTTTLSLQL